VFSARLPGRLLPNALTRAVDVHRASGRRLLDLTETNPTRVGLAYPADAFQPLSDPATAVYRPEPRGLIAAREAVAATYAGQGMVVDARRIMLTASTSEAYSLLFKLLCDPGSNVLIPRPGYPLFDLLTRLDGVGARAYRLDEQGRWSLDRTSIEREMTAETRAVLVVSPNNPTGSMLGAADREWLVDMSSARGIPLIVDEVFADYPLAPDTDAVRMPGEARTLTFSLGGLSKACGLPQLKLGWIIVDGPDPLADEALERLDVIADTYLSVSTPVQVATPRLLETGRAIRHAITARIRDNLAKLRERLAICPSVTLLEPDGGWSAVIQVPATRSEEAQALQLLEHVDVLVHPGYFFDFDREAFLVLSLLPEPAVLDEALARMLPIVGGSAA
jgi:aspartate/methionine/tyrosine aminotransferase